MDGVLRATLQCPHDYGFDAGILNLRPDSSGKTNFNRIKGLLGTLIFATKG